MSHAITVGDVLVVWAGSAVLIAVVLVIAVFGYSQFWWGHRL